jgi:hypothetical protein
MHITGIKFKLTTARTNIDMSFAVTDRKTELCRDQGRKAESDSADWSGRAGKQSPLWVYEE